MGNPFQMAERVYESYGNTKRLCLHSISHPSESKFHNFLVSLAGLACTGLAWPGLDWTGLAWTGLAWTGLAWTGLAWTGLAWTEPGCPKSTQLDDKTTFSTRPSCDLLFEILIWEIPIKWPGGAMSHMETQNVCVCIALTTHLNQNFTIFWFHSME